MKRVMDQELLSEEFLDTLYQRIPVMLMVVTENGEVQSINRSFSRYFDRTLIEMREMSDPYRIFSRDPAIRQEFRLFLEQAVPGTWREYRGDSETGSRPATIWTSARLSDGLILAAGVEGTENRQEGLPAQPPQRDLARRARQLQHLAMELTRAEQQERIRMSRVLHDDLQQVLVCANYSLSLLKRRLKDDAAGLSLVEDVGRIIIEAVAASRSISHDLNPPILTQGDLRDALEWLADDTQKKEGPQVRFRESGPADAPEPPETIKLLLYHATRELLRNALRHANARQIILSLEWKESEVQVSVEDDGIGFDTASLDTDSITPEGIGLFGIRERLDLLGGKLKIESEPGNGSRIRLFVPNSHRENRQPLPGLSFVRPALSRKEPLIPESPMPDSQDNRITVLLADDHRMVRKGLAALLSEQDDIRVVGEAGDGEEALQLALDLQPEVVVVDVEMPRMNGVEATRRIREFLPDTKIIGLSMIEEPEMAARMVAAGATCYLSKAGPTDFLLQAIREDRPCLDDDASPDPTNPAHP